MLPNRRKITRIVGQEVATQRNILHIDLMYIMYVDESGDTGLINSPTRYFALSGIVVHESRWRDFINALIAFRKTLRTMHGLPIRAEIHASELINHRPFNLQKH